jgi:hypothetical protein
MGEEYAQNLFPPPPLGFDVPRHETARGIRSPSPGPGQKRRKKALLIGCNYVTYPASRLWGCVSDVKSLKKILVERYSYAENEIQVLCDEGYSIANHPTRDAILHHLREFVKDADKNTTLCFSIRATVFPSSIPAGTKKTEWTKF